MRYILSIAYVGLVVVTLDRQVFPMDAAICLLLAPVALGAITVRWWALFLPLVAVLVAVPLGFPDGVGGEPFPTWFSLLLVSPVEAGLIAVGVGGRKLWQRRGRLDAA